MTTRRELITLVGGAAAAWPVVARGQQGESMRRVGVLLSRTGDDRETQTRLTAFLQELQKLGWADRRNVRIEIRSGGGDADHFRKSAEELLALRPDVVLATASPSVLAFQRAGGVVPTVFVNVGDPVGAGFVESLARPGGNITGFMQFEFSLSGKWLELLKQIAPHVTYAGVLRDATLAPTSGIAQFASIQGAAPSLGMEAVPLSARNAEEVEKAITTFAQRSNGGLIVTAGTLTSISRELIVKLAARHRLPTVYPFRYYVDLGGLICYGPDPVDQFQRAAGYVDRILKGEKPADMPVQAPTKYELAINLKTAKALGITVPQSLLARADEIIE